ncbi:MAG: hypothetical protein WDN48_01670 [Pseudolabrys sp.]
MFALATVALLSEIPAVSATEFDSDGFEQAQRAASIDVVRIKSVLRLTPMQEAYWPPVETALRGIARQQAHAEPEGFMRRIGRRVISVVLNSAAVERLAVAARPLLAVLNDEQKRAASGLAQEMGLGPVVMAALR